MTETSKGNTGKNTVRNTNSKPEMLWVVQDFNCNQNSQAKSRTGCGRLLPWAGFKLRSLDFAKRKSTISLSFYDVFVFVWLLFWLDDYRLRQAAVQDFSCTTFNDCANMAKHQQ